jgi:hypothetical protein
MLQPDFRDLFGEAIVIFVIFYFLFFIFYFLFFISYLLRMTVEGGVVTAKN